MVLLLDVAVDYDLATSPHNAVLLVLKVNATRQIVRTLKKPRTFPCEYPIGCRRPGPVHVGSLPTTTTSSSVRTERSSAGKRTERSSADAPAPSLRTQRGVKTPQEAINDAYVQFIAEAEAQLCHLFDCVDDNDCPDPAYIGRGRSPEYVYEPIVNPRGHLAWLERRDWDGISMATPAS